MMSNLLALFPFLVQLYALPQDPAQRALGIIYLVSDLMSYRTGILAKLVEAEGQT